LLVADGFTLVRSFTFTLIITLAQLPGYAAAAWLIEVWGRRVTLAVFLVGSAISAGAFGMAETEITIIIAGCFLSFFNLAAWGALYAIGPALYSTQSRGRGAGAAAGCRRVASNVAPPIVPPFAAAASRSWRFVLLATASAIASVAAFAMPENKGKAFAD